MFLILVTWLLTMVGHIGVWCVAFNRTHATALPRRARKWMEKVIILAVVLPIIGIVWTLVRTGDYSLFGDGLWNTSPPSFGYSLGCLIISPYFIIPWLRRKYGSQTVNGVKSHTRRWADIDQNIAGGLTDGWLGNLFGKVPFNQATRLMVEEMEFEFEQLPKELDGLKIVQLSDTHLTGQIRLEYFQAIVQEANALEPDFVFITGDLVDEHECLDWLEPFFGQLRARFGVYFILGNHDCRIKDQKSYRARLAENGLIAVGGAWHVVEVHGKQIAIAGNELPWFTGAEKLELEPPQEVDFKILLSHSPDQFQWAQPYRFDLMFAGHTHGGQIQLPLLGPLVAPSKFGVKYASGTFMIDMMLMHVSRGISGDESIRIDCPPELGHFVLRHKAVASQASDSQVKNASVDDPATVV